MSQIAKEFTFGLILENRNRVFAILNSIYNLKEY